MGALGRLLRRWLARGSPPPAALQHLEGIETEVGNRLLESLKAEGWAQVGQYSPLAFDKGIDYDCYRLCKDGHELKLEWDNWSEWTLSGPAEQVAEIARRLAR